MRDQLLHYLRAAGVADATMYGHLHAASAIASELAAAHADGRAIAIVGYSLGGFQAVKVARELDRQNLPVCLLAIIGSGGPGRLVPSQWFADHRRIPANVDLCLNYASEADMLGSDREYGRNLAIAARPAQAVENQVFPRSAGIAHMDLVRCYPESRVNPLVRTQIIKRIQHELVALETMVSGNQQSLKG